MGLAQEIAHMHVLKAYADDPPFSHLGSSWGSPLPLLFLQPSPTTCIRLPPRTNERLASVDPVHHVRDCVAFNDLPAIHR